MFLPADFHKPSNFKKYLSIAERSLGDSNTLEHGKVDAPLLLVGLMCREVSCAMEMEPGGENAFPIQLRSSPFGIQQMQKIERVMDGIVIPK